MITYKVTNIRDEEETMVVFASFFEDKKINEQPVKFKPDAKLSDVTTKLDEEKGMYEKRKQAREQRRLDLIAELEEAGLWQ